MTEPDAKRGRALHETRLLLLTIVVCVVVLLLLSRLRFPDSPPVLDTTVQPLERLAARASYDALAADIERLEGMISPSLVVLRTAPRTEPAPRRIRDILAPPTASTSVRHVAALRINAGTALAAMTPDVRIEGIVGSGALNGTAAVLAIDPVRRIGHVRVPDRPERQLTPLALSALRTPVYVVAVEATQAGVTLRPIFLGRGDRFSSVRWPRPLLPLGGIAVSPGALLFSFAGEFVGCVVVEDGAPAIAGARDVLETVERLASAPLRGPGTLGLAVQPLTPDLGAALGADRGVVVAEVEPKGAAAGILRPGDVLTALDGNPVYDPDRFLLEIASRPAGESVSLAVVRQGESLIVAIVLAVAEESATGPRERVAFERSRDGVTRVVAAGRDGGYGATGLQPGDIIVGAADLADPSPPQLRRLLASAKPDTTFVFAIRRQAEPRVVAVRLGRQ